MESCQFKAILTLITFSILSIAGGSRDLRPSEHGLSHQTSPATSNLNSSAAMTSFFGKATSSSSSSPPSPMARNSTGSPTEEWWSPPSKEENKRLTALKVAAIACGGAGVVLLVAAGLMFVYRFHKRKSGDASLSRDGNSARTK